MIPTLDEITPEQWRQMAFEQRERFRFYWKKKGVGSFCCIGCGYPTSHGVAVCVACRDHSEIRYQVSAIAHASIVPEDVVINAMAVTWYGISGAPVEEPVHERMRQLIAGLVVVAGDADNRALQVAAALGWA